jgi:hypothetical protein
VTQPFSAFVSKPYATQWRDLGHASDQRIHLSHRFEAKRFVRGKPMLLDAIATAILAGLMFIPLVNVIVGGVVGAGLAGPLGGFVGILLAVAIAAAETWLADRMGWRDLRVASPDALEPLAAEVSPASERTIKTGPPKPRRQSRLAQATNTRRLVHAGALQRGAAR